MISMLLEFLETTKNGSDYGIESSGFSSSSDEEEKTTEGSKKKDSKLPRILLLQEHRRAFSECWLAVLKLPMTYDSYKRILLTMHKKIIPHMLFPQSLLDFLTESYNAGTE